MAEPLRLLMVCLGNICRSPMAEGALRSRLRAGGLEHAIEVDSAGLGDWHAGQPPDRRAIACAAHHGVDIRGQRARTLRDRDYAGFDWLLCADRDVLNAVIAGAPVEGTARIGLLLEATGAGRGDIADPYTGDEDDFDAAWRQVDAAAQAIVTRRGLAA